MTIHALARRLTVARAITQARQIRKAREDHFNSMLRAEEELPASTLLHPYSVIWQLWEPDSRLWN